MNDVEMAMKLLEQSIKYCVELGLGHFHTATGSFPKSITVELGALVYVSNVEMPRVTISIG